MAVKLIIHDNVANTVHTVTGIPRITGNVRQTATGITILKDASE